MTKQSNGDVMDDNNGDRGASPAEVGDYIRLALQESFLNERFQTQCCDPTLHRVFRAARLEKYRVGTFPRVLLDPNVIDSEGLEVDRLEADLEHLLAVVKGNPDGLKQLAHSMGDAQRFIDKARALGITEADFLAAGGGLWWIVVVVVAVTLTGCPGPAAPPAPPPPAPCPFAHPIDGTPCTLPRGHNTGPFGGVVGTHVGANGTTW